MTKKGSSGKGKGKSPHPKKRPARRPPKRPPAKPRRPAAKPAPPKRPAPKVPRPTGWVPKKPPAPGRRVKAAERLEKKRQRREKRRSYTSGAGTAAAAAAAVGATAAAANLSTETREQLDMLSQQLSSLQQAAALVDVYEELEDTDSALYVLPEEVEEVRSRGFAFANYLERKIQVLSDQWTAAREQVVAAVERRSNELAHEIDEAERVLQAAYSGSRPAVARAENSIRQLESKVTAAQDAIESMFDTVDENVTQVMYQLERINWTLDQAAEASFDFYEGEDVVAACRAQLVEDGEEGPKGILHITDDRLVFEQKEEIATKKILFITTEKELVQEMLLETPIGQVEEMKASQSGFLGRKDMLEIHFAPGSRYTELHLHLQSMDNKDCIQLINRVRTGEIDRERVQVEGEEEAEQEAVAVQVEEIPTKCPSCGASFTTPIVRGMRELACDYCGTVVRL